MINGDIKRWVLAPLICRACCYSSQFEKESQATRSAQVRRTVQRTVCVQVLSVPQRRVRDWSRSVAFFLRMICAKDKRRPFYDRIQVPLKFLSATEIVKWSSSDYDFVLVCNLFSAIGTSLLFFIFILHVMCFWWYKCLDMRVWYNECANHCRRFGRWFQAEICQGDYHFLLIFLLYT